MFIDKVFPKMFAEQQHHHHPIRLESSPEDNDQNPDQRHGSYPPPVYINGLFNDHHEQEHGHPENIDHDHQHHAITTTLYQNRSVSIINCEYKLKEKYPHLITLIFFFVIYITMILLGSSLFMAFEAKAEQRLRDQILNKQQTFLEQNQCVDPKDLKQFINSVIITYDKGVNLALLNDLVDSMLMESAIVGDKSPPAAAATPPPPLITSGDDLKIVKKIQENLPVTHKNVSKTIVIEKTNQNGNDGDVVEEIIVTENKDQEGAKVLRPIFIVPLQMSNWEFGSSLTYVASIVTTIGYGHVTPITNEGKILTIVFGAIAIPCTLLFLSIVISMIRDGPIKQIEVWLIKLIGMFTEEITLLKIRFLHLFMVTVVLFSLLIILPAFLFKQMESQWTFLDSFYYCFITITTVGFGDYVPGQNGVSDNRTWYLISIVIYMYTGLCMMMLWIALVLRIPYFNFKTFLVIEEPELSERKLIVDMESNLNSQQQQHHHTMENVYDGDDEKMPLIASTSSSFSASSISSGKNQRKHEQNRSNHSEASSSTRTMVSNQDLTYQSVYH